MGNKWISVEKELPEIDDFVLWYDEGFMFVSEIDKDDPSFEEQKEKGIKCPTHWQALPLPPIKESVSNESISEDEVLEAIIHNTFNESWDEAGDCLYSEKECINVAKQYSSSKLEGLKKWVTENGLYIEDQDGCKHIVIDSEEILTKIRSLK